MTKTQRRRNKAFLIRNSRIFKVTSCDGFHGFKTGTLVRWYPLDEQGYVERRYERECLNVVELANVPYPMIQWVPSDVLM